MEMTPVFWILMSSFGLAGLITWLTRKRKKVERCCCFERAFDNPECPIHRG